MYNFADRMKKVKASDVREILKVTARPEIISFAGGLPAPELFPIEPIREASDAVLRESGRVALQYGPTEGLPRLREQIAERMLKKNAIHTDIDHIIMTAGSQQGLDYCGMLFLNPGDAVVMESPSYLGAINAFNLYQPNFLEVPTDENGMIMEELDKTLTENKNVKLIYVIPDFQNPSGRTWPLERRKQFMEIVNKHDVYVIEDNPYGELRYKGEYLPALKSMDTEGRVIYLGTFSKILAPGYRLAWICADKALIEKFALIAQAAVLQTATISMMVVSKFLDTNDLDAHVDIIRETYKHRCDVMLDAMDKYFPPEAKYTRPDGGLFTWVELPGDIDTAELLKESSTDPEVGVAFVAGAGFFVGGSGAGRNCMRMSFGNNSPEKIREGVMKLGKLIEKKLAQQSK